MSPRSESPNSASPRSAGYSHVAVMGDLVGSETVTSVTGLHAAFNEAIERLNDERRAEIASPLTVTLGDEFQGLCRSLSTGLSIIRTLRRRLLASRIDCRFVLGVVRLETPLNTDRAWNMMGPGLAGSREKLADKRDPNVYRFHLPDNPTIERLLEAVGLSISSVESAWTDRQVEIVAASLDHQGLHADLAARLGVSQRAFYKVRRAARLDFYESLWNAVEHAIGDLDRGYGFR